MAVFTDDFNRADQDLSDSANWGPTDPYIEIVSNQVECTSSANGFVRPPDTGSADHYAQAEVANTSIGSFPVCVRATDISNYFGAWWTGSAFQVYRRQSGSFTGPIITHSATVATSDVVKIEVSGNNIELFVNGSPVGSTSDSFNNTETYCGIHGRVVELMIDNWESDALGGGGAAYYRHVPIIGPFGGAFQGPFSG